jgi:hypothetical protein
MVLSQKIDMMFELDALGVFVLLLVIVAGSN